MKIAEIDDLDIQIIMELLENAKQPYTDVAKRLYVSGGTVHVRMKKLETLGVVEGATLNIDYSKLGYDIGAFLGIYLEKSSLFDEVSKHLQAIPEVIEAHYTTGIYSIFARIICRDTKHLREVLHDKIQNIAGIQRTETFISLQQSFSRPVQLTRDAQHQEQL
jgi:Lrp/AsnC family transcriptional regulator for asnA, asnC and gidA